MMKHSWKAGSCALLFATWQMIPALATELSTNEIVRGLIAQAELDALDLDEDLDVDGVESSNESNVTAKKEEQGAKNDVSNKKQEDDFATIPEITIPNLDLGSDKKKSDNELDLGEDLPSDAVVTPMTGENGITDGVLKRNQLMQAKKSFSNGTKAREAKAHARAQADFDAAEKILAREFPGQEHVKEVAQLMAAITVEKNQNVKEWAERLAWEADQERNANKIADAIDKLRSLILYHSKNFEGDDVLSLEKRIKELENKADEIDMQERLSASATMSDELLKKQDKLYTQALFEYQRERYDEARAHLNQMLVANPYERRAMRLSAKITEQQRKIGFFAAESRRMDMITATIWNWVNTLPPSLEDFADRDGDGDSIEMDVDTQVIRKRLDEIVVNKDFEIKENYSLEQIRKILEDLSLDLDPTGNGVKFVLVDYAKHNASGTTAPAETNADADADAEFYDDVEEPVETTSSGPVDSAPFADWEIGVPFNLKSLPLSYVLEQIKKYYAGRIDYEISQYTVLIFDPKKRPVELEERTWTVASTLFGSVEDEEEAYVDEDAEDTGVGGGGGEGGGSSTIITGKVGEFFEKQGVYFGNNMIYTSGGNAGGEEEGASTAGSAWIDAYNTNRRAYVSYNTNTRILRMVNTREMLDRADDLVNTRNIRDLVRVEAKFVEVQQTNDDILAFRWTIANGLINYNPGNHATGTGDALTGDRLNGKDENGNNIFTGENATGSLANNGKSQSIGLGSAMSEVTSGLRDTIINSDGTAITANPLLDVWGVFGGTAINMVMSAVSQSNETNVLFAPQVTTLTDRWARLSTQTVRHFFDISYDGTLSQRTDNNGNNNDTQGGLKIDTLSFLEGVDLWVRPTVQSDRYTIELELVPDVVMLKEWQELDTGDLSVPGNDGDAAIDIRLQTVRPILSVRRVVGGAGSGFVRGGGIVAPPAPAGNGEDEWVKIFDPLAKRQPVNYSEANGVGLSIWDGETVVLGGLINERIDKFHDKVPFLGEIPFVGRLFQSKGETSKKYNLMIFVNARIVNQAGIPIRQHKTRGMPDFTR